MSGVPRMVVVCTTTTWVHPPSISTRVHHRQAPRSRGRVRPRDQSGLKNASSGWLGGPGLPGSRTRAGSLGAGQEPAPREADQLLRSPRPGQLPRSRSNLPGALRSPDRLPGLLLVEPTRMLSDLSVNLLAEPARADARGPSTSHRSGFPEEPRTAHLTLARVLEPGRVSRGRARPLDRGACQGVHGC